VEFCPLGPLLGTKRGSGILLEPWASKIGYKTSALVGDPADLSLVDEARSSFVRSVVGASRSLQCSVKDIDGALHVARRRWPGSC